MIARQADRAVGEQGEESSEWRGRRIGKWWRLEASDFGGFGEEKRRNSDFQQGAEGTKPRGRGFDPHRRRSATLMKPWIIGFLATASAALAIDNSSVRVAAIQCYSVMGAVQENTSNIVALVRQAADSGAKIIVTPECSIQGYLQPDSWTSWSLDNSDSYAVARIAETVPGKTTSLLAELSDELNVYLCVGIIEVADKAFYNSQVLLDPNGKIIGHHRKKTLWTPGDSGWCTEGNLPVQVIETEYGRIGMMICFDFHTLPKELAKKEADLVVYSIGWYGPNGDQWFKEIFPANVIIPNRFSVIGANWSGGTPDDAWPGRGHSFIAKYDGTILSMARTEVGNEVVFADLPIKHSGQNKAVKVQNPAAGF